MSRIMIAILLLVADLGTAAKGQPLLNAEQKADRADKLFRDGVSHDFGKVQHGAQLRHSFRIVNTSDVPMRIVSIHLSMSPVLAWSSKDELQPNEEGTIEVAVDTRRFVRVRTDTIFVLVHNGKPSEHRLWVRVESSRDNLATFPDSLDFGKITRGGTLTKHVIVAVPDQPKLRVTGAKCDSKCVQIKLQELGRGDTTAIYKLSATLQADTPEGDFQEEIELATDNPAMPKLRVPLRAVVETAK